MISNLLHHLGTQGSMGAEGIHPGILRKMIELPTKPLSIICQPSCLTRKVPVDWKSANVTHKKSQKEDLGNYNPVSLTREGHGADLLRAMMWHVQDNKGVRLSQHDFMEGECCLTILVSFCDKVICLVDEGKAEDVVYLGFGRSFVTISLSIVLEKLAVHDLDSCIVCWVKNWPESWAQRMVVNRVKSI
ncbi:hypothetical protein DUI87_10224 [Hirundo rustica rustica]|uniref:Uncharacterized protein n=1 Tax=Hirundo rustica rustica TaxID=333673 RepID=A0A3M0KHI7_HIRRU|nr:hypothetical protein DUI87_10224 [Hirundo rustica rustica]